MARVGYHASKADLAQIYEAKYLITPQSLGWEHYEVHEPEPHILLFKYVLDLSFCPDLLLTSSRRPINYQPPVQH